MIVLQGQSPYSTGDGYASLHSVIGAVELIQTLHVMHYSGCGKFGNADIGNAKSLDFEVVINTLESQDTFPPGPADPGGYRSYGEVNRSIDCMTLTLTLG
jgi:hypothetical protein